MINRYDIHQLIVPACAGCNKVSGDICETYINPTARHRACECPLKSNKVFEKVLAGKKVNPIKVSKKASKRGR
ncbi:hypothetical protein KKF82_06350 [Patescibacteria group bacterium]|nr:hypothetical protein [Patescibacteria group bacterium]